MGDAPWLHYLQTIFINEREITAKASGLEKIKRAVNLHNISQLKILAGNCPVNLNYHLQPYQAYLERLFFLFLPDLKKYDYALYTG